MIAEPAEAQPGETVRYRVLAVDANGPLENAAITGEYCTEPKALVDPTSFGLRCLDGLGERLELTDDGSFAGSLPEDACRIFGPDPPPGDARPRDPDVTLGYAVPVVFRAFGQTVVHLQRVFCAPGNVAVDVAREYSTEYEFNRNPSAVKLNFTRGGAAVEPDSLGVLHVEPHHELELRLRWEPSATEQFAAIDRATERPTTMRETLRAEWFATFGELAVDRHEATSTTSEFVNVLGVGAANEGYVWVVVHDSRGGSAALTYRVEGPLTRPR